MSKWQKLKQIKQQEGYLQAVKFIGGKALQRLMPRNVASRYTHTIKGNLDQWSQYDWSARGEEWTPSVEWLDSFVEHVLEPSIPVGSRVLEIGPGAGRWTQFLASRAQLLTVVDLTPECIRLCEERFRRLQNIRYFVNDGKDLSFIPPKTVDRIWSFDVFVHIRAIDVEDYVRQFAKLLAPGGEGIIHHSAAGANTHGWRSDMTAKAMTQMCEKHGLRVLRQFDSWADGRFLLSPELQDKQTDVITMVGLAS